MNDNPTLHSLDKALATHVAECTKENRLMWQELRSLKHIVWVATGGVIGTLGTLCFAMLKAQLHL